MRLSTNLRAMTLSILVALATQADAVDPPNVPPGFTMDRTGDMHDFDYFQGGWTTVQHRLSQTKNGKPEWQVFPGNLCMRLYLDGYATVDELYFPTLRTGGLTLRTFDRQKRQWSIHWVSSTSGTIDPVPTVGGFHGNRGEFYAADRVNGRPAKVRYLWIIKDHNHARWEQALSYDDRNWDTNWTADFTRAEPARICRNGRPIH